MVWNFWRYLKNMLSIPTNSRKSATIPAGIALMVCENGGGSNQIADGHGQNQPDYRHR